jgi:tetratricopeptide (TPR) repeat protein
MHWLSIAVWFAAAQPDIPLFPEDARLAPVHKLLRHGKTSEARKQIQSLMETAPGDAELQYQLARSYLMDFYEQRDAVRRRTALALAMEALDAALKRNADHIPALKSKAMIHAQAELLHYDPNLAYDLAARVAKLQPSASEYLLGLTDWLSGEVRFSAHSEHRVPHDPALGLDRSVEILERVVDSAVPYSSEEAAGYFQLGKALAKRGDFPGSVEMFELALSRPANAAARGEILRETGVSYYRLNNFAESARAFYRALETGINVIDQWLLAVALGDWKDAPVRVPEAMQFAAWPKPADVPGLRFEDIAPRLGLNRKDGNGTVAWGDYDGDGKPDVFLAGAGTFLGVYRNEGERFREVTAEVGLAKQPSGYSLNLVDYDNDGDLDLYLCLNGWSGPMPNRLFRNTGGKFADVTGESGAGDPGSGFVSLWGDLDNDGWLDLAIANGVLKDGSVPRIYRNLGNGKFADVTGQAGLREPPGYGAIGIALGDYDGDRDLDLFVNGLQESPNRLYRNEGGMRFVNVAREAGLAAQPPHNGFVAFFTDYNNDARPDLLVTSLAPWPAVIGGLRLGFAPGPGNVHADATRLYRNNGNGTFTDVTAAAGLAAPMGVMGAGVADLDNDGYVDFYFGTGDPQLSRLEPNRLFHNNGDGTFTDVTAWTPFARPGRKGHGVAFLDLDDDGDLEMYAQLGGHYPGDHAENAFYRNLAGQRNNWLELDLGYAVGAQVVVKAGPLTVHREVKGGEGFGATNVYRQHFGLGRQAKVDSIEVIWPGGDRRQYPAGAANRLARIRPNSHSR